MQTKTKTYANSTTADNSPVYNLLPSHSICNENSRLTDKENELLKTLCQSKSKSSYARTIRQICKEVEQSGDSNLFRELINMIQDMGQDNPRLIKNIIGTEAYTVLLIAVG
jgi:hypothetical protein